MLRKQWHRTPVFFRRLPGQQFAIESPAYAGLFVCFGTHVGGKGSVTAAVPPLFACGSRQSVASYCWLDSIVAEYQVSGAVPLNS